MRGYDWDDEIQVEIANKIRNRFEQLKKSERGEDSPMSAKSRACQVEMHSDISVYIWCEYHNYAITSRLITAE